MSLRQLIYVSALAQHADPSCVGDILRVSASNNALNHVTGMLLYAQGSFLQVLEGEPLTLAKLYHKICNDPRHTQALKLIETEISERQFGQWSMGMGNVSVDELQRVDGMNDFFAQGHCLTDISEGVARRILAEFREGKWRERLS